MLKSEHIVLLLIFSLLIPGFLPGLANAERLDLNTATESELTSLPYIGTIRARTIIDCRHKQGPFKELEEILICEGIGPDTLKIMQADLEISGSTEQPHPQHPTKTQQASEDLLVLENTDYFPALLNKIRGAQTTIDMAMFVFKTTKSAKNRPGMVAAELQAAAERGVRVRVFLEKSGYDDKLNKTNQETAKQLQKHGIEVAFDSPNITTHTKLVVIDRRYSFVGSHNFTDAALKYNNELSLLINDQALAQKLTDYIEGIINR